MVFYEYTCDFFVSVFTVITFTMRAFRFFNSGGHLVGYLSRVDKEKEITQKSRGGFFVFINIPLQTVQATCGTCWNASVGSFSNGRVTGKCLFSLGCIENEWEVEVLITLIIKSRL